MCNSVWNLRKILLCCMAFVWTMSTAAAQTPWWGLQRQDRFSVETVFERETALQLDDSTAKVYSSRDTLIFEYQVQNELPGGDLAIRVSVMDADRKTDDAALSDGTSRQLGHLREMTVVIVIDPDGTVKGIPGFREALHKLADVHGSSRSILNSSISQDVFAAWLNQPFRVTAIRGEWEVGSQTEFLHQLTLGPWGAIRTVGTAKVESIEDGMASLQITGNARHVPLTAPADNGPAAPVQVSDVKVQVEEFSGTARVVPRNLKTDKAEDTDAPPEDADPQDAKPVRERPPFEASTLTIQCSGDARVSSGGAEQQLHFEHKQIQTSRLLPNHRIGVQPELRIFEIPAR